MNVISKWNTDFLRYTAIKLFKKQSTKKLTYNKSLRDHANDTADNIWKSLKDKVWQNSQLFFPHLKF